MKHKYSLFKILIAFLFLISGINLAIAQDKSPEFDTLSWDIQQAKIVEHLGRKALIGTAYYKDLIFENGIIEIDLATTAGTRSYPALLFRVQDPSNFERIYIRPHRSPFYEDALQYAPTFNGVDSWQLYNGPGKTTGLEILPDKWNRLTIKISGDRAQVFWNEGAIPVLTIDKLAHGESSGLIGLSGGMDGSTYFSNLHVKVTDDLDLPPALPAEKMQGVIEQWELSESFSLINADFNTYSPPGAEMNWQNITADKDGSVDISKYFPRNSRAGDVIFAKTNLPAEEDTFLRIGFGYSDYITVYLDKKPVFTGNSAYRSRDPSFLGIMGYFDVLFLPLKKGDNELLLLVGESMGGWGFCARKEDEIFMAPTITKTWETKNAFSLPECVVYDPRNKVCYVSNYFNEGKEYISKVSLAGEVIEREWVTGVVMPTGMAIEGNLLYSVNRTGLTIIDINKGEIIETVPLAGIQGQNDVAIGIDGSIYLSDTRGNKIFLYKDKELSPWMENLDGPNGLLTVRDHLLVGENHKLLKVDLADKSMDTLAFFDAGSMIDGIQLEKDGVYLVSDYRGRLYRITDEGGKTLIIDTFTPAKDIADFAYAKDKRMIIIPTFRNNSVVGYALGK
jgi:hypothetical protein